MGLIQNFFNRLTGNNTPKPQSVTVSNSLVGSVFTISRLLGSSSTLSLVAGGNSNLTLSGNVISATAALGSGNQQKVIVREASDLLAIEYPVTITGDVTTAPTGPDASVTLQTEAGEFLQTESNTYLDPTTIPDLPLASTLYRGDSFIILDQGVTKRVTLGDVTDYLKA